jgi:hypothetical protein
VLPLTGDGVVTTADGVRVWEAKEHEYAIWDNLSQGALDARHLGLVPPDALEDHRNPEPVLYVVGPPGGPPWLEVTQEDWDAPEVGWPDYDEHNYWEPLARPHHHDLTTHVHAQGGCREQA